MSHSPPSNGSGTKPRPVRDANGRFVKGNPGGPGNPFARKVAVLRTALINFVTVDAYVSDSKGQPATDLKQSDFEVLEDNKPQKIEAFRFIKVDGNPKPGEPPPREIRNRDDEEREAARDDTRVFVIFLDTDLHR